MLTIFFYQSYRCRQVRGGQPFKKGQIFLKSNLKKQAALKPNKPTQNLYLNDRKQQSPSADVCQLPRVRDNNQRYLPSQEKFGFFPKQPSRFCFPGLLCLSPPQRPRTALHYQCQPQSFIALACTNKNRLLFGFICYIRQLSLPR